MSDEEYTDSGEDHGDLSWEEPDYSDFEEPDDYSTQSRDVEDWDGVSEPQESQFDTYENFIQALAEHRVSVRLNRYMSGQELTPEQQAEQMEYLATGMPNRDFSAKTARTLEIIEQFKQEQAKAEGIGNYGAADLWKARINYMQRDLPKKEDLPSYKRGQENFKRKLEQKLEDVQKMDDYQFSQFPREDLEEFVCSRNARSSEEFSWLVFNPEIASHPNIEVPKKYGPKYLIKLEHKGMTARQMAQKAHRQSWMKSDHEALLRFFISRGYLRRAPDKAQGKRKTYQERLEGISNRGVSRW